MMKYTIAIALAALSLAGCKTTGKELAGASIDVICRNYSQADITFEMVAATGRVSADVVAKKRKAAAVLAAVCADPPKDAKTAVAAAGKALTAFLQAAAEARRQAGG